MALKRNYRLLRGPAGPRGMTGQSAYGLWLQEGNQGDIHRFFSAIGAGRDVLLLHEGGQRVPSCGAVRMQNIAGAFVPGKYIVQYMLRAQTGAFALYCDAIEVAHSRYRAQGTLTGVCVVQIFSDTCLIDIRNVSLFPADLDGNGGCVDAYLWARPID